MNRIRDVKETSYMDSGLQAETTCSYWASIVNNNEVCEQSLTI